MLTTEVWDHPEVAFVTSLDTFTVVTKDTFGITLKDQK